MAGLGNPGTILGRHLSPRFLNLPGEGGQGWGTQTPGRGCQVPGARLVWPRGLEGRPTGHGVALARAMSSSWPAGNRTTGMKDWGAQSRTLLREGSLTPGQPPCGRECCSHSWNHLGRVTDLELPLLLIVHQTTEKVNFIEFMPVPPLEPETDPEQSCLSQNTQRVCVSNRGRQSPEVWKPHPQGLVKTDPKGRPRSRN